MPGAIATFAVLLDRSGSGVALATVAVSVMSWLGSKPGSLLGVVVIAIFWPPASVPKPQANSIIHPSVFDTNIRPTGTGLVTLTVCATSGPLFVLVSEYVTRDGA